MRIQTLVVLCVVVTSAWTQEDVKESRIVDTAQGPVRGYKDPDSGVFFFQSIPYASTPTGPNRFKAPLPPPIWMQPLEAVRRPIACPQAALPNLPEMEGQREDCLIASVYVPDTEETSLPVVVYVHGGAFQMGSGDMAIPSKLVAQTNIVAVTFNYRIGPHGFLCLGTEDVPGNAGMKDQVAALRWVKNNIANFGGNPDAVTIAGYSAGSASVDLLMLSKSAAGLFNKVIPESGASIAQWTIQSDPLENAKEFAKSLNFTNVDDIAALEHFYKTVSFKRLTSNAYFNRKDSSFYFSPCIERSTGEEVFLDESPIEILKSGDYRKLPLLYGFTNMEGLLRVPNYETWKHDMNETFTDFLPSDLKFESIKQRQEVANQIKEFYFGDEPVGDDNILGYVDFFSDVIFKYPMLRAVKYHLEVGHDLIYLYEYSFVDDYTPTVPHTAVKGANHCDQTSAIFGGLYGSSREVSKESEKMSIIMRTIWGNFIKTGHPLHPMYDNLELPAWPAVRSGWGPHMSLSNDITLRGSLLEQRARFWDDIYEKFYRDPVPPPNSTPRTVHSEL